MRVIRELESVGDQAVCIGLALVFVEDGVEAPVLQRSGKTKIVEGFVKGQNVRQSRRFWLPTLIGA